MVKRLLSVILSVSFLLGMILLTPVFAAKEQENGIDLTNQKSNASGDGYYWNNRQSVMTFSNLRINTSDEFGFRLPSVDLTLVIEGDNYIKADKSALECYNGITFKGDGTLILISGDKAIYVNCTRGQESVRFAGGRYKIKAPEYGIYAKDVKFSAANTQFEFECSKVAIISDELTLNGVSASGTGTFRSINSFGINDCSLSLSSSEAVFACEKSEIALTNMDVYSVAENGAESKIEAYGGESSVRTVGTTRHYIKSILFGEGVSIAADLLILLGVIIVVGVIIFLKVSSQRRKDRKKTEEIEKIRKENKGKLKL